MAAKKRTSEKRTPAEPTKAGSPEPRRSSRAKAQALLEILRPGKPIYIMTHDHPDPDALASAAGLHHLIKIHLGMRARIVHGGLVERPENRTIKTYLRTRFSPLPPKLFERKIALVLVDSQPGAGNHPMPRDYLPTVVVDHHPIRKESRACPFYDIKPGIGACATLVANYLRSTDTALPTTLATALSYAITSETRDLGREASEEDIETYAWLLKSANLRRLSLIEHARVPRDYFLKLHATMENAFVYKDIIGSCLGRVSRPDLAAQMADLLLTHERMRWSICSSAFKDRLYISIRTTRPRARCAQLLKRLLGKEGSAGGHGMIAGGYLPLKTSKQEEIAWIEQKLMLEFIKKLAPPGTDQLPPLLQSPKNGH